MALAETPRKGRFLFVLPFAFIGALALLGAWLAPNHYPPWTSFHGEAAAFVALVAFVVARLVAKDRWETSREAFVIALLVPLIWIQWSVGLITFFGDAVVSSLFLSGLALAWWLGANSTSPGRTSSAVPLLAALVVTGASLSVLIAVLQWLRIESAWGIFAAERGPDMRPYGNLGQPNHLATLSLMGCVLGCLLFVRGYLRTWQLVALLVFLSFGLILTESRTGRISAGMLGLFLLWRAKPDWGLGGRKAVVLWWALLAMLEAARVALSGALLLQPSRDAVMTQDDLRLVMWKQMVSAIGEAPWLGYGWRQTIVAQKTGARATEGTLVTDYAHNIVLDILVWVGLPLGCLLLLAVIWWFVRTLRTVRDPVPCLLFASVIPVLVHSLLEFPFAYAYFLFPVGWILGFLAAHHRRPTPSQPAWTRPLAAACVLAFASLCTAVFQEYLQAEEDYRVMRFELRRVGTRPADHAAPQFVWLTQLGELLDTGRMTPYAGMPARDIERLRIANQGQGWATLHLSYAVALGLNGQPEEATRQLRDMRSLYGGETYRQTSQLFRDMQADPRYSQLATVAVP